MVAPYMVADDFSKPLVVSHHRHDGWVLRMLARKFDPTRVSVRRNFTTVNADHSDVRSALNGASDDLV
jgi:hypothetical protein